MSRHFFRYRGNFVATAISIIVLVFVIDTGMRSYAQSQRKQEIVEDENFHRPEPSKPISPQVPSVNRYQEDKVFLEYADSLYKRDSRDTIVKQILKGNVKFRQAGLWMFCDSAYYYPEQNSLDAFSNVRMEQGDTLFVYADKLFYNGDEHLAKLKNGPTREKVVLINNDVTLTTDSLDYDMAIDLGWYTRWGTIEDQVNTLTSLYGEYSPKTKRAEFFTDVVLVNHQDGFTMLTDTLYYSTETHIANIESRTEIQSENDTIITNLATYYTDTGDADLLSRSLIIHRDSTGNVTTLEGDSIIYDNTTRISRAYMFRDPFKQSNPMVITDTAQKTTLIGGFGIYNDSTKEALATIYPLLMEYSQGDTLFLRADTIKTFIITDMIANRKRTITKSGYPEFKGMPIVTGDSTGLWIDTSFFSVKIPYVDTPLKLLLEKAPPYTPDILDTIIGPNEDVPLDTIANAVANSITKEYHLDEKGMDAEDDTEENEENNAPDRESRLIDREKLIGDKIRKGQLPKIPPRGNMGIDEGEEGVIEQDTLLGGGPETSIQKIEVPPAPKEVPDTDEYGAKVIVDSIAKETHVILAYHRARFFKQDMQGVADSMVMVERDSMLYMFRKPIIWSEERQVTGNRIDVHFNDSTTDWAYLPEFGLMSEHVDEDFYNQIYGKEITTYFEDQGLRRMSVSGNVETIFLPQEADSTFNRLINAESSYMEVYLDSNKLDWLKMWPEVSGTVTPLFMIKRNQMYLQKFKWWGFLRPEREWYGNKVRWADNLGEVPDELEQYFMSPSDFGEPKSFTGTRVILPPSSLPIWEGISEVEELDSIDVMPDIDLPPEMMDSIPRRIPRLRDAGNLNIGEKAPGLLKAEKRLTIGDIMQDNEEEEENAEITMEQSEAIKEEVQEELTDEAESLKEESPDEEELQTETVKEEEGEDE
ncbi:MAG: hypothetical protein J1F16_02625 [Muribaculaceae bacterium]|nr:hypothetical protein [Muribaculaceae bacterium]